MSEATMAAEPAAEKHFTFAGHEDNNPLNMLDECQCVVEMLSASLTAINDDDEDSRGFVIVLDRLRKSLDEIEAVVAARIKEPYAQGFAAARKADDSEYLRGFREGVESARRNRHAD